MANVRASRNGSWGDTDPATSPWGWGGVLYAPTYADDVWTNGFVIDVTAPASCASLQNNAATSRSWKDGATAAATAGGKVNLSSTTLTAEINPTRALGPVILVDVVVGATAKLVGNVNGGSGSTIAMVNVPYGSSLTLTGVIYPQTNSSNGCVIVEGYLEATGGVTTVSGVSANSSGIYVSGNGIAYVIGDLLGSTTHTSLLQGTVRHNGALLSVTGNVIGALTSGIYISGNGNTFVTGNVSNTSTGASQTSGPGIYSTGTGILNVVGDVSASVSTNGIVSTSAVADVRVSGNLYGSVTGFSAVNSPKLRITPSPVNAIIRTAQDGVTNFTNFFTADYSAFSMPSPSNVRSGSSYASGALTGTCHVPSASSVAAGVPVDNTVGTAVLTPAAVQAIVGAIVADAIDS